MERKDLVPGSDYAYLPKKAPWEIPGELRHHVMVRYFSTSCVGMKNKPGYVIVAERFTSEAQRLVYVKSSDLKMTWESYRQRVEDFETAKNKERARRREEMEKMEPDIRSLFSIDEVQFDVYEGRFSVSVSAMQYLLQLHGAGVAA